MALFGQNPSVQDAGNAGNPPMDSMITGNPLPATPAINLSGGINSLLQQIYDKIQQEGAALIADMQKAQAIAATSLPNGGGEADQPSALCLGALIPVVQLIIQNQVQLSTGTPGNATGAAPTGAVTPSGPDGPVTAFVKIRVVVNAIQSSAVQSNCSWLMQTVQQVGTQGIANVLAGLIGLGKLPLPTL